jgi:hypothetical protein
VEQWERASNNWPNPERKDQRSDSNCASERKTHNKNTDLNNGACATHRESAFGETSE